MLKKSAQLFTIIYLAIVLFSCNQSDRSENAKIPYLIDLTQSIDETDIDLDDYLENIKIVKLEANKNTFLKYFKGYIGEKYIISFDSEKVVLFSSDGKYITTIIKKGKGPQEFSQIDAWAIDDNEQFLVFHDHQRNYIFKYNIERKEFERNIPFKDQGYVSEIALMNDSVLAVLPSMFTNYGYLFFYQSTSGKILDGIKKEPVPHPGAWGGASPIFTKDDKNSILFKPPESDTIFQVTGTKLEPKIVLEVKKPQKTGDKTVEDFASILFWDNEKMFFQKDTYEKIMTETYVSFKPLEHEFFIYKLPEQSIQKLDKISFKYKRIDIVISDLKFYQNQRLAVSFLASDFKNILEDNIIEPDRTDAEINQLEKLNNSISVEDNPIIITGKCK